MTMLYRLTRNNKQFEKIYKLAQEHFKNKTPSILSLRQWLHSLRESVIYISQWQYIDIILKYF